MTPARYRLCCGLLMLVVLGAAALAAATPTLEERLARLERDVAALRDAVGLAPAPAPDAKPVIEVGHGADLVLALRRAGHEVRLTADVELPSLLDPVRLFWHGHELAPGVDLNLNGHTITAHGNPSRWNLLAIPGGSQGATIRDGTLRNVTAAISAIDVKAPDATISNVRIVGSVGGIVTRPGARGVRISGVEIDRTQQYGILVDGTPEALIEGCQIGPSLHEHGIRAWGFRNLTIRDNTVRGDVGKRSAINVQWGTGATIEGNRWSGILSVGPLNRGDGVAGQRTVDLQLRGNVAIDLKSTIELRPGLERFGVTGNTGQLHLHGLFANDPEPGRTIGPGTIVHDVPVTGTRALLRGVEVRLR